jgi:hypothetical protein
MFCRSYLQTWLSPRYSSLVWRRTSLTYGVNFKIQTMNDDIHRCYSDDPIAHTETCWSCNSFKKKRRSLFCIECNLIQPPPGDDSDFFDMFGL